MTEQSDSEREQSIRSDCEYFEGIGTDDVRFLLDQLSSCREALGKAEKDAKRLDFIEAQSAAVCASEWPGVILRTLPTAANTPGDCDDACDVITTGSHWTENTRAETLREAIDSAMQSSQGSSEGIDHG